MSQADEYRPRLSIQIPAELRIRMLRVVPHGYMSQLLAALLEDLIFLLESTPEKHDLICGMILQKKIKVSDVIRPRMEAYRKELDQCLDSMRSEKI